MAKIEPIRVEVEVVIRGEIVHMCPPEGSGLMPCCGRTPFEVPLWSHRITLDAALVTCKGYVNDEAGEYVNKWADACEEREMWRNAQIRSEAERHRLEAELVAVRAALATLLASVDDVMGPRPSAESWQAFNDAKSAAAASAGTGPTEVDDG